MAREKKRLDAGGMGECRTPPPAPLYKNVVECHEHKTIHRRLSEECLGPAKSGMLIQGLGALSGWGWGWGWGGGPIQPPNSAVNRYVCVSVASSVRMWASAHMSMRFELTPHRLPNFNPSSKTGTDLSPTLRTVCG